MLLYLLRHGESDTTGLDNERALSDKGKQDIQRLAQFIALLKLSITELYHSDKLRAKQTAELLVPAITLAQPAQTHQQLSPLAHVQPLLEQLAQHKVDTMLVGHMPFLGKLLNTLITGNEASDLIVFKAGSMICLEQLATSQWLIRWFINPEILS